jgi:hypothetical protein
LEIKKLKKMKKNLKKLLLCKTFYTNKKIKKFVFTWPAPVPKVAQRL